MEQHITLVTKSWWISLYCIPVNDKIYQVFFIETNVFTVYIKVPKQSPYKCHSVPPVEIYVV